MEGMLGRFTPVVGRNSQGEFMEDHVQRTNCRRTRLFVDSQVQAALLKQMSVSWLGVLGFIASVMLAVESYRGGFTLGFHECLTAMWDHNAALIVALVLLAPLMILDALRISHKFAGPMVSFRRALERLASGDRVDAIRFRENDAWKDIADNFNLVAERLDHLESATHEDSSETLAVTVLK